MGPLEALGCAACHSNAGTDGTRDGHQAGGDLVVNHHGAGFAGAQDNVEDTGREDLAGQACQHQGGLRGGGVGRLQDNCVACGQGGADLPDGHEERVVPRSNLGYDADRFATYVGGVALEVFACGLAFDDARCTGEEAELVSTCGNFLGGDQGTDLTGVAVLGFHEFIAIGLDGVCELEEHQLALAGSGLLPRLESLVGRGHGGVHIGLNRNGRLGNDFPRWRGGSRCPGDPYLPA